MDPTTIVESLAAGEAPEDRLGRVGRAVAGVRGAQRGGQGAAELRRPGDAARAHLLGKHALEHDLHLIAGDAAGVEPRALQGEPHRAARLERREGAAPLDLARYELEDGRQHPPGPPRRTCSEHRLRALRFPYGYLAAGRGTREPTSAGS